MSNRSTCLFMCVIIAVTIAAHLPGCAASEVEAEAAYLSQQLKCVEKARTLDESKTCRRGVRERWGIAETVRDGGLQ